MRTRAEADALASDALARIANDIGIGLAFTAAPVERHTAWVYFYTSRQYLRTGDLSHALAGNGPIVVPRAELPVWFAWTGRSIDEQVE